MSLNKSCISESSKSVALLIGNISLKNRGGLFLGVLGALRYLHFAEECSWEKVKQQIEILAQY